MANTGQVSLLPTAGLPPALKPLPDMTIVEVSIIVALLRKGPAVIDALCPVLAEWFMKPVARAELASSVDRLRGRGWLVQRPDGELVPAPSAYEPTSTLYTAFIRMLAREAAGFVEEGEADPVDVEPAPDAPVDASRPLQLKLIAGNDKVAHDPA